MKLYIFIFLTLMESIAWSCPVLVGSYFCKATASHPDTIYTFSQTQQGTDWQYTMQAKMVDQKFTTSYQFLADGVEREISEATTGYKLLLKASCLDGKLKVEGSSHLDQPHPIHFAEDLSRSESGDLVDVSQTLEGSTELEICTRMRCATAPTFSCR